eukprot:gnl/Spiro4/10517_TR5630_c0_g1_i1.p1 gnl/Spiro4/10517_TR5630_c0_g1~~gnl/Spiro4/10517_TR5630_c0_g1_i1.p1  ORF type:complete len:408 (+),score=101.31 gnl/Spiro4/10517_TR5630_c0_g1_i1:67-1224(+)
MSVSASASPGYITVLREDVFQELANSGAELPKRRIPHAPGMTAEQRAAREAQRRRKEMLQQEFQKRNQSQQLAIRRAIEQRKEEAARAEPDNFESLFDQPEHQELDQTLSMLLNLKERSEARKKEALYSEWKREVYEKIQSQVERLTDGVSQQDRRAQRRSITRSYNTGGIHTQESRRSGFLPTHKYSTKHVHDPLKRDLLKTKRENQLFGEVPPTPSQTYRPLIQHAVKLNSTGMCEFGHRRENELSSKMHASHFVFDHYTPKLDSTQIRKEMGGSDVPTGKRILARAEPTREINMRGKRVDDRRRELGRNPLFGDPSEKTASPRGRSRPSRHSSVSAQHTHEAPSSAPITQLDLLPHVSAVALHPEPSVSLLSHPLQTAEVAV